MSYSATGIIYFSEKYGDDVQNRIATYLVSEAAKRGFGIFLGASILLSDREKFEKIWHIDLSETEKLMPFSLSDSFLYSTCQKIFEPMYINNFDNPQKRYADVSGSSFPAIQDFFISAFRLEEIMKIRFDFESAYGMPEEFTYYKGRPEMLCVTVEKEMATRGKWDPSISFEFIK